MMPIQHHEAGEYYRRAVDQFEQIYADSHDSARVMARSSILTSWARRTAPGITGARSKT
jgi:hypothetical protein